MSGLKEIELGIDQAKAIIEKRNRLVKLLDNPLFVEFIEEDYIKSETKRLVQAKAAPLTPDQERNIDKMIYGVGSLQMYIADKMAEADAAQEALAEYEETREELIAEGDTGL